MHAGSCELLLHHARARPHWQLRVLAAPRSMAMASFRFASSSLLTRPPAADWLAIIAFSGQSCLGALQRSFLRRYLRLLVTAATKIHRAALTRVRSP
jgi:hypothetical protein